MAGCSINIINKKRNEKQHDDGEKDLKNNSSSKSMEERLQALKVSDKDHQKILDDVKQTLESCRKTQEHLTKTQEKLKVVKDENGNIVGAVSDLEAKWKAFQDAFDQMNKQMIANIAASMGKEVNFAREKPDHKQVSIKDSIKLIQDPKCKNIVVLTGAGISVESGIPTYRGNDGFWKIGSENYTPQEIATRAFFEKHTKEQWRYHMERKANMSKAKPNDGHYKLKELEDYCRENGKTFQLVTQNIDGLHGKVGHKNEVYYIHGDMNYARCPNVAYNGCNQSNKKVPFPKIPASLDKLKNNDFKLPKCKCCGSILRPHVLWFDESYSEELYRLTSTINAVKNADVLIVIGTCYQTSLPQRILGLCKTNNTPILDVNPNLNDDVFSAPLLMVKETGTVFLNTLMDKLNKKKKTIKSKKNRKK